MSNPTLREGMESADGWVEYLHDLLNGHFYGRTDFKFYKSGDGKFDAIDAKLLELAVPTDEWDILYRLRLQAERDDLIGAKPGTEFPGHDAAPPQER